MTRCRSALRVGGIVLAVAASLVVATVAPAVAVPHSADPMQLLHISALASHNLAYAGTQVVAVYGEPETVTVVADVVHLSGRGSTVSIHATPNTPARKVFEPDAGTDPWTTVNSGLGSAPFGSTALLLIEAHYTASLRGPATVAGRPVTVIQLARGSGQLAARFWLDDATKLPLRREFYDDEGELTRVSAYLDFTLRPRTAAASTGTTGSTPVGRRLTEGEVNTARVKGWVLPSELGALQLVEIRKASISAQPKGVAVGGTDVMHFVYSDGLSTVSVFQQKGRLRVPAGWRRVTIAAHHVWVGPGVPTAVTWSAKGRVFTVVADSPAKQLASVIVGLPKPSQHGGLFHRLRKGLDRIGSWFNPFH